jgi:hypothetical protein
MSPNLHRQRVWVGWVAGTVFAALTTIGLFTGYSQARGPQLAFVSGRVSYHGQPVRGQAICLDVDSEHCGWALLGSDGWFEIRGAGQARGIVPARYQIHFITPKGDSPLPSKYAYATTSGLEINVLPDWNRFSIDLL